jgi:hypothetical protein
MSPTIGISLTTATMGVTKSGPMIGTFCSPKAVRRGVCGMATTLVGGSVAAVVLTFVVALVAAIAVTVGVGSTGADVVTGSTALARLGAPLNSCRAAASIIHGNGDAAGAAGELPANGFRNALTTFDIAVVTVGTGGWGCSVGFSMVTSAVVATDEAATLVVSAGSLDVLGCSAVLVDWVAAAFTVWDEAESFFGADSAGSCAGLVDWSEALDFFFFFDVGSTASVFGSVESVVVLAFSSCSCLLFGEDAPGFDPDEPVGEAPDAVDDDPDLVVAPVSADATPCPTRTAAPIPRAAASPPIRPTYAPAAMHICIPAGRRARPQLGRISGHCVGWVNFRGGQPRHRHAEPVGPMESPP